MKLSVKAQVSSTAVSILGLYFSREEKEPQRALAYHSCSPGLRHFLAVGIIFFVPKSFSLSNTVILSLKKTSVQKEDSIWNTRA